MSVSAKTTSVSKLLDAAILYRDFRAKRSRPLDPSDEAAVDSISAALHQTTGDQVTVDQAELTAIHSLSDAMQRAHPAPLRVAVQVHCITSFLAVAIPWLFENPALIIAAPLAVPYYCFTVPVFGGHPIYVWIATHLSIRYALLVVPSYFIVRDIRYREFTKWPYLTAAAILIAWPVYFYVVNRMAA